MKRIEQRTGAGPIRRRFRLRPGPLWIALGLGLWCAAAGCRGASTKASAPRLPEPIADPFLGPSRIVPPPLYVPPGGGGFSSPAPAAGASGGGASGNGASLGGTSGGGSGATSGGPTPLPQPPTSIPAAPPSAPPSYPSTSPSPPSAAPGGRPLPGPSSESSADRARNGAATPSSRPGTSAAPYYNGGSPPAGSSYDAGAGFGADPGDRGAPTKPPEPPAREAEREPAAIRRTAAWVESGGGGSKFWTPRRDESRAAAPSP